VRKRLEHLVREEEFRLEPKRAGEERSSLAQYPSASLIRGRRCDGRLRAYGRSAVSEER